MTEAIQVVTTTGSKEAAQSIAGELVKRELAACVQVGGPITSTYRWKGEVESSEEWLCTIKTRRDMYAEVERAIAELHSYDEPEILATPVVAGSDGYLEWLGQQVKRAGAE